MNINKYRLIVKAIELKNLSKAASELGYTQSGASHQIKSVEDELGIKILQRDRSGTKLTTEGKLLLPYIREAISCEDKILAAANSIIGMQIGSLKVGTFTSVSLVLLPIVIGQFHHLYPKVQIEMLTGEGSYPEMEQFLLEGITDCSFVSGDCSQRGLNLIHLFDDSLCLVLPPKHPLAFQDSPIMFHQLSDVPFLMPTDGNNIDILHLCRTYDFTPSVAFTMHDDLALLAMAENGLGCTILPKLILNNYPHKAAIKYLEGYPTRSISIATRIDKVPSPIVSTFLELTQKIICQSPDLTK